VLGAQRLGLQARGRFEGPGSQTGDGGGGHLLHLVQVNVQAGPGLAKGMANDHFSPLPGQFLHVREIGGCELPCPHDSSSYEVKAVSAGELPFRQSNQVSLLRKVVLALFFL
jgi:hypothetical protein